MRGRERSDPATIDGLRELLDAVVRAKSALRAVARLLPTAITAENAAMVNLVGEQVHDALQAFEPWDHREVYRFWSAPQTRDERDEEG